ncbi:MAG: ferritin-like domain-containing protein [Rhodospirillales bacterium]|nr:ferritin-like domain-containing protein [Rhodospirillales bacterium]
MQIAEPPGAEAVAAADRAARHWEFANPPPASPLDASGRVPTETLRAMLACLLRETFNPYKPAVIDWPKLDDAARERLINLPIWDIAVQTEGRARLRILSYARRVADPGLREAFELMAFEEGRHKEVLANLVAAYGIALDPEPTYVEPKDPEWGFLVTGYSECIDSFFAFGLFELARRSGFFPEALVDTFEPVIQEEGRHILFFVNWLAWHKRTMPLWRRPWFFLKTRWVWLYLIRERIGLAKDVSAGEKENANFTVEGASAVGGEVDTAELMALCLTENDRRLAGYDPRLKPPRTVPFLVRRALPVLRWMARPKRA